MPGVSSVAAVYDRHYIGCGQNSDGPQPLALGCINARTTLGMKSSSVLENSAWRDERDLDYRMSVWQFREGFSSQIQNGTQIRF